MGILNKTGVTDTARQHVEWDTEKFYLVNSFNKRFDEFEAFLGALKVPARGGKGSIDKELEKAKKAVLELVEGIEEVSVHEEGKLEAIEASLSSIKREISSLQDKVGTIKVPERSPCSFKETECVKLSPEVLQDIKVALKHSLDGSKAKNSSKSKSVEPVYLPVHNLPNKYFIYYFGLSLLALELARWANFG